MLAGNLYMIWECEALNMLTAAAVYKLSSRHDLIRTSPWDTADKNELRCAVCYAWQAQVEASSHSVGSVPHFWKTESNRGALSIGMALQVWFWQIAVTPTPNLADTSRPF